MAGYPSRSINKQKKNGIRRVVPSGQDSSILPAWVANHSAGFDSSCPLTELALYQHDIVRVFACCFTVSNNETLRGLGYEVTKTCMVNAASTTCYETNSRSQKIIIG